MDYTTLPMRILVLIIASILSVSASQAEPVTFQSVINSSQHAAAADQRLVYGNLPEHYGLLWLPRQSRPAPLVVLVHGGCWLQQYDVNHIAAAAVALRDDGYAVWAPEYRRASAQQTAWPQALNDVVESIDFIRAQASSAIASDLPIIIGHSAGGHLALLASTKTSVKAVIGLAAITDITSYAAGQSGCQQAARWLLGGLASDPDMKYTYQQANPRLQSIDTSVILLASEADNIVPIAQASYIRGAHVHRIAGAGHFDFIYPGSAAWQQLQLTLGTISAARANDS
jgi:acetyl esterase/lipase